MKIGIVGPGALGCVFASYLSKGGEDVFLVDYREERAKVLRSGLEVISAKDIMRVSVPVWTFDQIKKAPDLWILCVKNYSLSEIAEDFDWGKGLVLPIQNGLGVLEKLRKFLPSRQILPATTHIGATLLAPGKVRLVSKGTTFLDGSHGRGKEIEQILETSGLPCRTSSEIQKLLWEKAILNSAINPLTALVQLQNGFILESPFGAELCRGLLAEGVELAEKEGVFVGENLWEKAEKILAETAENFSSMAQDVQKGGPTEIESLNKTLYQKGLERGIELPFQKIFYLLIRCLEEKTQGTQNDPR